MGVKWRVRLERLNSTNKNLRTNVVEGVAQALPEVGKSFCLKGVSLTTPGVGFRWVETSPVVAVHIEYAQATPYTAQFQTENSTYTVEFLDIAQDEV